MSKFIINGGKKLSGEIIVSGSKNALFPLFAASLLTQEKCTFANVPEITDKEVMIDLIRKLGAVVEASPHRVSITAANIVNAEPDAELTPKLRGSILLLGALLGRIFVKGGSALSGKKVRMIFPGGDIIGRRPIEAHLKAFEALGATTKADGVIELAADKLIGCKIVLEESSVTATENVILASVLAAGQTIIKLAAMEPHVQQLCEFLNKMGAKIAGIGTTTIIIDGVESLHGAEIEVIPDSNEAASFITLAAATQSDVKVSRLNPEYLDDLLLKLKLMNVNLQLGADFVHILPPTGKYQATKIQCGLYPKLPSDDIPPLAVLATQSTGESLVYEWLYENRLGYVEQLKKMGATAEVLDPHRVKISGVTKLKGAKITSYDIRMGMTLVIAALVAEGQSELDGIEHIDRGYERLDARLQALGADIKRL